jgi:hypothetical protein
MSDRPPPAASEPPAVQLLRALGRVALKAGVKAAESGIDSVLGDAEDVIDVGARTVQAFREGIRARRERRGDR